jgi:hypothetical protein
VEERLRAYPIVLAFASIFKPSFLSLAPYSPNNLRNRLVKVESRWKIWTVTGGDGVFVLRNCGDVLLDGVAELTALVGVVETVAIGVLIAI